MKRRVIAFALVALCVLPFSSCTCSSSTPESPPAKPTRAAGFSGIKPTMRSLPQAAEQPEGVITPGAVETKAPPTLPPASPGGEARIPDNFPSDVPVYAGAKVMGTQVMGNKATNVIFGVDAERPEVFKFYKDSMVGSGWKTTQQYEGNDQSFLTFEKDGTTTNVIITNDPKTGKKVIAVMYYKEEPLPFAEF
ncbi:MAG: hypothetical protein SF182_18360 [Deltaproteobacteria bacterium]|nr:hypothetical protein [Deltaproteobacteria bacterium]